MSPKEKVNVYSSNYSKYLYVVTNEPSDRKDKICICLTEITREPYFISLGTWFPVYFEKDIVENKGIEEALENRYDYIYRTYPEKGERRTGFKLEPEITKIYKLSRKTGRFIPVTKEFASFLYDEGVDIYSEEDGAACCKMGSLIEIYKADVSYIDTLSISGNNRWLVQAYECIGKEADFLSSTGNTYAIYALKNREELKKYKAMAPGKFYLEHMRTNMPTQQDYVFRGWGLLEPKYVHRATDFIKTLLYDCPDGYPAPKIYPADLVVFKFSDGPTKAYFIERSGLYPMDSFF